jgi:hypothetical protein
MAEDMRFHYVLSYTPSRTGPDGHFRQIAVELARRGLSVRTRSGYIAGSPEAPSPALRAIAALQLDPAPDAFPIFAEAMHFPAANGNGRIPVFVEVPGDALGYAPDQAGRMRGDLTLIVRVSDESGQPRAQMHQRYAPVESTAKESLLFHPQIELGPGRYTLEAVGYDAVNLVASVRTVMFSVPERAADDAQLSSLVVAKGVRRLAPEEGSADNPLAFDGALLQPNLGEAVRKSQTSELGFFFVAVPSGANAPTEATVEVWKDGSRVRSDRLRLEPRAEDGCVRQAGSIPISDLEPADYRLRVTMASSRETIGTEAAFTLAE